MSKVVLPSDEYYSNIINRNKTLKEGFSFVYWSAVWEGVRYLTTQPQVESYNYIVYYDHYLVTVFKLKLIMCTIVKTAKNSDTVLDKTGLNMSVIIGTILV